MRPPTTTTSGGIVAFLMAYSITPRSRSAASSNSLASKFKKRSDLEDSLPHEPLSVAAFDGRFTNPA